MLLLIGTWSGADAFVLRPIKALLAVATRLEAGNLGARTSLGEGKDELARLGHAFDSMASALQARDLDLQHALHENMQQLAIIDPLTGLHNRRYLGELLGRDLLKARRSRTPVAAIVADIDHFKRFNDTWGHEAGDLVLKRVADVIREHTRGYDIACRYGGEELAVILPGRPRRWRSNGRNGFAAPSRRCTWTMAASRSTPSRRHSASRFFRECGRPGSAVARGRRGAVRGEEGGTQPRRDDGLRAHRGVTGPPVTAGAANGGRPRERVRAPWRGRARRYFVSMPSVL